MSLPFINAIYEIEPDSVDFTGLLSNCVEENKVVTWLKYHRAIHNMSQIELLLALGYTKKQKYMIENIETRHGYPSRELSQKLATFFNTGTKYFYDDYYEMTDDLPKALITYRKKNNLSRYELSFILKICYDELSNLENGKKNMSRKTFLRCKYVFEKK